MEYLHNTLNQDFISKIISISKKRKNKIFLVGGILRDAILDRRREKLDVDFAVDRDAIGLAREFARQTKSGFVVLDREHGCARAIYKGCTLDFTDFRGKDLKEDLLHRDFTINTLALQLPVAKNVHRSLIDYYGAKEDLNRGLIKITSNKSFNEDYLRILRAFSLSAILKFEIDKKTLSLAKRYKDKLLSVAGERLRDELFKILDTNESIECINLLDKMGILSRIIPQIELMRRIKQGPYHHLDVWGHSLEALRQLEKLFCDLKDNELNSYLNGAVGGERKRKQLIKLVCLLHDIGKPQAYEVKEGKTRFHGHERIGRDIADAVSGRLKLSTKEKFAIDTMIFWHLRPGYLADNKNISERAKFRYFRDSGIEAVSILLLSISDQRATRGPKASSASRIKHEKVSFELIREYFKRKKEKKFERLINGDDLIKKLKLEPSPLFKKILQEVEESQAEGKIKTKKQALDLAKKITVKKGEKR
ncbi:MAG: HD domain-containing protein [Candidatus Omnitrophota bacterium]